MSKHKKQEFTNNQRKKGLNLVIAAVFLLVFAGIAIYVIQGNSAAPDRARYTAGDFNIGQKYSYDKVTSMTRIDNEVIDNNVVLSLDTVKNAGIIYTQVPVGNKVMPITSYIAPSGRLVVAFSICEPCNSDTFRIEGKNIICESCSTIWTLEELKAISGGCMDHPPEEIFYEVNGDDILIPYQQIKEWTPRKI